jgi:uncharacterized protein
LVVREFAPDVAARQVLLGYATFLAPDAETERALNAARDQAAKRTITREPNASPSSCKINFIISTKSVDRSGDRVLGPWDLTNFKKNPVVLWAHQYNSLPVARCTSIEVQNGQLVARAEFMNKDLSPMADQVFELYKQGFLKATSVGFQPIDAPVRNSFGGVDFGNVELLEFSCVPVPANAEALMRGAKPPDAKSASNRELYDQEVRGYIERSLDVAGLPKRDDLRRSGSEVSCRTRL